MNNEVRVRREPTTFPTYEPAAPDRNPMFLEKRVYQGSSGKVYPLPVIDRIAEEPVDREWDSIFIENGLVEVMLLPEIGGRIHAGKDLSNGYEFFYRQNVIKPALVGLAGPWASGGVEFNWPQHHRPSTWMPTNVVVEHGDDGSVTVWMGEHEPMDRTKGMHGVCLHPGRSVVELKVRLYNRTQFTQTFLWWTNIGTHVHEGYRSFFPPDAHTVADHAKRALSTYPLANDHYYGVDYGARGRNGVPVEERPMHFVPSNQGGESPEYAPNDLSWYANIPVPTSYMCMGTDGDFVGGYDHFAKAGLLHIADHRIAPGKKQWTWGNHEFGYAWDRNLTDSDGPYIELMAGVYTDNQPDFSWIAPGETKVFSQFWYPYQAIGPVHFANLDAALSLTVESIGVAVTRSFTGTIAAYKGVEKLGEWFVDLAPDKPFLEKLAGATSLTLLEGTREIARYDVAKSEAEVVVPIATEPRHPEDVDSADELFLIGQHLFQYRHATRNPVDYWLEALKRDPGDVRCNNGMGVWHLRRGEFQFAEKSFRSAIARATERNPNPADGEPYYNLGVTLRFLGRDAEALDAFGKAVWSAAWQAAGYHAMGEIFSKRQDWTSALDSINRSIRKDADNFRAVDLRMMIQQKLGHPICADEVLNLDGLDHWARYLKSEMLEVDNNVRLDLAIDFMRAGFDQEAVDLLVQADLTANDGTVPMVLYYRAFLSKDPALYVQASAASTDYCFPSRLEDIAVLESAPPNDPQAAFYLGNLFYDRRRHLEAIALWERAVEQETKNSIVYRNLGIAYFNVKADEGSARSAYHAAIHAAPEDARLRYERDQLWKRIGVGPEERLGELGPRLDLVLQRDDLTIEFCALLNAAGRPEEAEKLLASRRFQPWEGGEGAALGMFTRTKLQMGQLALKEGRFEEARDLFLETINPPENLSEARHLLANASDVWLYLGDAYAALGDTEQALRWWSRAAEFKGDFKEMSVVKFSDLTYFQALALKRLGRQQDAITLLQDLESYADDLGRSKAVIDYFATSLPTMLLFDDDLQKRLENEALFMKSQAAVGLEMTSESKTMLEEVLRVDPNHARANDLKLGLA